MTKLVMNQYKFCAIAQMDEFCRGTIEVAELLRVDLEIHNSKCKREMEAFASLLQVDFEVDEAAKHREHRSGVQVLKPMYSMDATIDGDFQSLLEIDNLIDGKHISTQLVDPAAHKQKREGEVFTSSIPDYISDDDFAKINSVRLNDGEDLIEHIFGIPSKRLLPKIDALTEVKKVDTDAKDNSQLDDTGNSLIRHLFGTGLLDLKSGASSKHDIEASKGTTDDTNCQSKKKKLPIKFASFFKKQGKKIFKGQQRH